MDPLPQRKPQRLPEYDYSANGAYFVTVCTQGRRPLFGHVRRGDPCGRPPAAPYVHLTDLGQIVQNEILNLDALDGVSVPAFIVMPDHIHMILVLDRATARVAPTLGQIIGGFKSKAHHRCLSLCKKENQFLGKLWQRGYYEHIIRNRGDHLACWDYILHNPGRWLWRTAEN